MYPNTVSPSVFAYPPPTIFPGSTPLCLPSEKNRIPRHNKHKKTKYNMTEKKPITQKLDKSIQQEERRSESR